MNPVKIVSVPTITIQKQSFDEMRRIIVKMEGSQYADKPAMQLFIKMQFKIGTTH